MQLDINFLVHTETVRITTFCYRKLHSSIKFVVYYFEARLPFWEFFYACALLSPLTFLTGDHVHKSDLTRTRLPLCRHGFEITVDEHVMIYTYRNFISTFLLINTWWYILVATLWQLFLRWTRDDIFMAQLYSNFPCGEYVIIGSLSNSIFERRTSTGSRHFVSLVSGLVETLG